LGGGGGRTDERTNGRTDGHTRGGPAASGPARFTIRRGHSARRSRAGCFEYPGAKRGARRDASPHLCCRAAARGPTPLKLPRGPGRGSARCRLSAAGRPEGQLRPTRRGKPDQSAARRRSGGTQGSASVCGEQSSSRPLPDHRAALLRALAAAARDGKTPPSFSRSVTVAQGTAAPNGREPRRAASPGLPVARFLAPPPPARQRRHWWRAALQGRRGRREDVDAGLAA
jgi:hypothetical protein